MSQIALPFDWPADAEKSDFLVTPANSSAVNHLDNWGRWPVFSTLLTGPRKSGRSLLGRIFTANTGAHIIDDAELHSEADIFHSWNLAQESRVPLLIIANQSLPAWTVRLPDLRSRLGATPLIEIGEPDETLCALLLVKLLTRRGVNMTPDVASFVATRMVRTYIEIQRIVDSLDQSSLSKHRALTMPFVRQHLIEAGLIDRGT
jgi:hypothetical protein